jgi:hypothetical protein
MTRTPPPAATASRRTRWLLVVCPVAVVALVSAVVGCRGPDSSASATLLPQPPSAASARLAAAPSVASSPSGRGTEHRGPLDEADGIVPDGVTVFDDAVPAVANLDPELLEALRRAAEDAADDGVAFHVNSGWRSPSYQEQLLDEAVAKYGSRRQAARWVATPTTSAHVSGDAVDLGPTAAAAWLSRHGAGYGLCQTYRNEPWHYELRASATHGGCPHMYADPTHDPRMQQ